MLENRHHLAAIMFTDIVGYTAIMGKDEHKAVRILEKNLAIQKLFAERHNGKLLKEVGDGLLFAFDSAIEAVQCAIKIQDTLEEEPELYVRIGIHMGDVLFKDDDVLGDGVNVASRIEHVATSGEILVSEVVYNNIKNQEDIQAEFHREEKQYFADGIMEDILTQLQRMEGLTVRSSTSVQQFRTATKTAPEIGAELDVGYLLEGSVRKSDNQVMISVQLIKAREDSHVWAENFNTTYTTRGIFDIQREIAEKIVTDLEIRIAPEKIYEITGTRTTNIKAYDLYQKAHFHYNQLNKKDNELAVKISRQAILADPYYADAFGLLSNAFTLKTINFLASANWLDSAELYANQGLMWNRDCGECYKALDRLYLLDPVSIGYLGELFFTVKDSIGFNHCCQVNFEKDPSSSFSHIQEMGNFWMHGDYSRIVSYYEENNEPPPVWEMTIIVPYSYMKTGNIDKAIAISGKSLNSITPGKWFALLKSMDYLYKNQPDAFIEWFEKAIDLGYLTDIQPSLLPEDILNHPRFRKLVLKQRKKREEVLNMIAGYNFPEPEDL